VFNICSLPKDQRQRPSVGNGYLATVAHGADMYLSGVYNGEGSQSHRAAIPSTCSFVVSSTEPSSIVNKTYELNVGAGSCTVLHAQAVGQSIKEIYYHVIKNWYFLVLITP